tara:strand:+ start:3017 stop:3340 length:324 start_codon:yes stop_codon:yes gene_type:complete
MRVRRVRPRAPHLHRGQHDLANESPRHTQRERFADASLPPRVPLWRVRSGLSVNTTCRGVLEVQVTRVAHNRDFFSSAPPTCMKHADTHQPPHSATRVLDAAAETRA